MAYMERDLADGVAEAVFQDTAIFRGGFPELTDRLAGLLDDTDFLTDLNERLSALGEAYVEDADKEICIQVGMGESQTIKTMIHEVAHAMLHNSDFMKQHGKEKDRLTKETEAESIAFTVCSALGIDESAVKNGNTAIAEEVKENFDVQVEDIAQRFRDLGLDDSLVRPSYVVNVSPLQEKINKTIRNEPEVEYHKDNEAFLKTVLSEFKMLTGEADA